MTTSVMNNVLADMKNILIAVVSVTSLVPILANTATIGVRRDVSVSEDMFESVANVSQMMNVQSAMDRMRSSPHAEIDVGKHAPSLENIAMIVVRRVVSANQDMFGFTVNA